MRYVVISPCVDARSGKEFEAGDEFLPEPTVEQAERLLKAGCLRVISDDAPRLPGTDGADALVADLQDQLKRAGETIVGLNGRVSDLTAQHDSLVDEYKGARAKLDAANDELAALRNEREQLAGQVAQLDKDLAKATKLAVQDDAADDDQSKAEEPTPQPGKPKNKA